MMRPRPLQCPICDSPLNLTPDLNALMPKIIQTVPQPILPHMPLDERAQYHGLPSISPKFINCPTCQPSVFNSLSHSSMPRMIVDSSLRIVVGSLMLRPIVVVG